MRDVDGQQVIRRVYRADEVYSGSATALAPDLIVGYCRGYRASWATCLGELTPRRPAGQRLGLERRPLRRRARKCRACCAATGRFARPQPALVDLAPSILAEFGLPTPGSMSGKNMFST